MESMQDAATTIKNGFRTCGLVPLNPDNINWEKYFKSTSTTVTEARNEDRNYQSVTLLRLLEKEIPNKINLFMLSEATWKGAIEDRSLFNLWHSLKCRVGEITLGNNRNHTTTDDATVLKDQETVIADQLDLSNLNLPIDLSISLTTPNEETNVHQQSKEIQRNSEENSENICINDDINASTRNEHNYCEDPETNQQSYTFSLDTLDELTDESVQNENNIGNTSLEKKEDYMTQKTITIECNFDEERNILEVRNNEENKDCETQETVMTDGHLIHETNIPVIENQATKENCDITLDCYSRNDNTDKMHASLTEDQMTVNTNDNELVLSPFKKSLFWPEPKKDNLKRKRKDKVPAVATSSQWQEYYKKKEIIKKDETIKKEMKKIERNRKKEEKEKAPSKKTKKVKYELSDSSENEDENNEGISINDYVIVNYNEQLLPRQINKTEYNNEGEVFYVVTHMERKGLSWKWPNKPNILKYNLEGIVRKIKKPHFKNKRGLYNVDEMSDYIKT